jgi:hypothetical protein
LLALVIAVSAVASPARADWLFAPFLGSTFGGSTALPDLEQGAGSAQLIFGGSAGWWSAGVFGIEGDFGYAPRFFERDDTAPLITSSNVATLSVDLVIATPVSVTRESLRPYLVGGLGWMHASIDESQNLFPEIFGRAQNSLGLNFGGGAVGFFTNRTGVRFELRHFRSLERDENPLTGERTSLLSFWRVTAGVVIRR